MVKQNGKMSVDKLKVKKFILVNGVVVMIREMVIG